MSETKDTAIKLFGKTISLPTHNQEIVSANKSSSSVAAAADHTLDGSFHEQSSRGLLRDALEGDQDKESLGKELTEDKQQEDGTSHYSTEDLERARSSDISENPKTPSVDRETSSVKSSKNGDQSETSSSQEKTLNKPDKILPCPRCNSMETKFCYYNNYNVNQPRHFCKKCQRYWTAGGTMRNVPVGAGRRKNKSSSASHYRHIMVSEALRAAQVNAVNNGTVLTFGSDSPLCESVASVLNLSEKTQNYVQNGFHIPKQRILVSCGTADNVYDHSSASSSLEKGGNAGLQEAAVKNYQGFPPQVQCFPGPPWPNYPWNSAMPPPTFCSSGFPLPFYGAPTYWDCSVPGPWNVPYLSSPQSNSSLNTSNSSCNSTNLGKHSRDGNILSQSNTEKDEQARDSNTTERSVLVPKTLRIDDPSEAAMSSIWATLGIKTDKINSIHGGGGLFKGFKSKDGDKNYISEKSLVLQANPAALSRSFNFHEST